ncbi:DUF2752 domain-containing protein [Vallitalea sediminicola]
MVIFNIVIITALALIIIVSAVAYIKDDEVYLTHDIIIGKCVVKEMTGHNCPSCGLTRSFVSISNGSFKKAFNYNYAGLPLYLLVICQIINSSIFLFRKKYNVYISKFNIIFSLGICFIIVASWLLQILLK